MAVLEKPMQISKIIHNLEKSMGFKSDIKWESVLIISLYHLIAVYWCYHYAIPAKWQTVAFVFLTIEIFLLACFMYVGCGMGVTVGVHRYWTHRSFKATRPLEILLFILFAAAGQTTVKRWVRNHRLHHKCSDTEADPHDARRGLFYSHIGWLMMRKSDHLLQQGRKIDVSDIESDPLLAWHEKNALFVNILCAFILPTVANVWLWGEAWRCAVAWQCFIRYLMVLHVGMTVNSLAHKYGHKPYNRTIKPTENLFVAVLTLGEGYHNYHHAFPFDYKGAAGLLSFNVSTMMIKACEQLGLAYDLKQATPHMVRSVKERLGSGCVTTNKFSSWIWGKEE